MSCIASPVGGGGREIARRRTAVAGSATHSGEWVGGGHGLAQTKVYDLQRSVRLTSGIPDVIKTEGQRIGKTSRPRRSEEGT